MDRLEAEMRLTSAWLELLQIADECECTALARIASYAARILILGRRLKSDRRPGFLTQAR